MKMKRKMHQEIKEESKLAREEREEREREREIQPNKSTTKNPQ